MDEGDPRWQEEYTRAAAERDDLKAELRSMQSQVDVARAESADKINDLEHEVGFLQHKLSEAEKQAAEKHDHLSNALRERDEARDSVVIAGRDIEDLRKQILHDRTGMAQALVDIRGVCEDPARVSSELKGIGEIALKGLEGSGTIIAKMLNAGIKPPTSGDSVMSGTPIEMGSAKAGQIRFLEATPNVHLHYIVSDEEMDRMGYSMIEIICHHCQTGTKVVFDAIPKDAKIANEGSPDMRKIRDDFEEAHQHNLGGLEHQWQALCPPGHVINEIKNCRRKSDGGDDDTRDSGAEPSDHG